MARSAFALLRAAAVLALASHAVAQTCYYANGQPADSSEKPCSSASGSACCPTTWQCLDNGLCYNPAANIYGRYSCTDKTWQAPGCPSNLCIYGTLGGSGTIGAEAITQCSNHNNDWCCDADRTNVNCCQESPSPRPFFQLQNGKAYATIGQNQASTAPTLSSITGLVSGSATANTASSATSTPSSSGSSTRASSSSRVQSSARPMTSEVQVVSSGSAGLVTITQTVVTTPSVVAGGSTTTDSPSNNGSNPQTGLIVGCAVGIPLGLALLGIIFWMLRKRRNQKKSAYKDTSEMDGDSTGSPRFAGASAAKLGKKDVYRHSRPGTSEIDSNPVGPGRPVSNIPGHAELESGSGFQPGHGPAYAPDTVGIGGGNGDGRSTWGTAPPGYSPGMNQAAFAHPAAVELDGTSAALPVINEKDAPEQYQAYRPPQAAAELPTAKTPPEDVEKQLQK